MRMPHLVNLLFNFDFLDALYLSEAETLHVDSVDSLTSSEYSKDGSASCQLHSDCSDLAFLQTLIILLAHSKIPSISVSCYTHRHATDY